MVKFFAAQCPQCSGDLQLPENKDAVKCMYCGTEIIVSKLQEQNQPTIDSLLELARHAAQSKNHGEAETYFTKVLEIDPSRYEAWLGKGEAAAWQSSLANFRGNELISCCEKTLSIARDNGLDNIEDLKVRIAGAIFIFAQSYHQLAVDHAIQFMGVPSTRYEHWERCRRILELCETALEYQPDLYAVKALGIDVCNRCLKVSKISAEDMAYFQSKRAYFSGSAPSESNSPSNGAIEKTLPLPSLIIRLVVGLFFAYLSTSAALKSNSTGASALLWIISGFIYLFIANISFLTYLSLKENILK